MCRLPTDLGKLRIRGLVVPQGSCQVRSQRLILSTPRAGVAKLVYAPDSKSGVRKDMSVRVRPPAPNTFSSTGRQTRFPARNLAQVVESAGQRPASTSGCPHTHPAKWSVWPTSKVVHQPVYRPVVVLSGRSTLCFNQLTMSCAD
jgi:hypothetical protein